MMRYHGRKHARNGERGVTMILVAVAMVAMLAMVALAVDVIALYAARSESQRAADSAALAAAKMLVDAGVTADPTVQAAAQAVAITMAQDVARQAVIAGRQIQAADVLVVFPNTGTPSFGINPRVTVTVQRTNLPTFFSRIWSRAALTVRTSATAEAFNPSNSSTLTGGVAGVPIVIRGVKPFLLPNCDPGGAGTACGTAATFMNPVTGAITRPGQVSAGGVIGETFTLQSNCGTGPGCIPGAPNANQYYPAAIPATTTSACPACSGGTTFEQEIACSNPTPLACGTTATLTNTLALDATVFPDGGGGPAQEGLQCLIHENGGSGQDTLNQGATNTALNYPLQIQVGNDHPLKSASLSQGTFVSTSDSLVTVPIYDQTVVPTTPGSGAPVTIIGFLQLFIDRVFPGGGGPKAGSFQATVVNVSGCGSAASGTPVFNGSSAAVPVRLTHQ
jgi:Flp pilus assembly protein TadG